MKENKTVSTFSTKDITKHLKPVDLPNGLKSWSLYSYDNDYLGVNLFDSPFEKETYTVTIFKKKETEYEQLVSIIRDHFGKRFLSHRTYRNRFHVRNYDETIDDCIKEIVNRYFAPKRKTIQEHVSVEPCHTRTIFGKTWSGSCYILKGFIRRKQLSVTISLMFKER